METVTLPDFLLCGNSLDLSGEELILSTKSPFWYCQVFKFSSRRKMETFLRKEGFSDFSRIMAFYNIAFVPMGMLAKTTKHQDFPEPLLAEMGNFYAIEKTGDEEFQTYFDKPKRQKAIK